MSLSEFKQDIYSRADLLNVILPSLSFFDALDLLIVNRKLVKEPVDPRTGKLKPFWNLFLKMHWRSFIENNVLANFNKMNKYNDQTITIILQTLKEPVDRFEKQAKTSGPFLFYIPTTYLSNSEDEVIFVYNQLMQILKIGDSFRIQFEHKQGLTDFRIEAPSYTISDGKSIVEQKGLYNDNDRRFLAQTLFQMIAKSKQIVYSPIRVNPTSLQFIQDIIRKNHLGVHFHFQIYLVDINDRVSWERSRLLRYKAYKWILNWMASFQYTNFMIKIVHK